MVDCYVVTLVPLYHCRCYSHDRDLVDSVVAVFLSRRGSWYRCRFVVAATFAGAAVALIVGIDIVGFSAVSLALLVTFGVIVLLVMVVVVAFAECHGGSHLLL